MAHRPVQSLSACTRGHFTFFLYKWILVQSEGYIPAWPYPTWSKDMCRRNSIHCNSTWTNGSIDEDSIHEQQQALTILPFISAGRSASHISNTFIVGSEPTWSVDVCVFRQVHEIAKRDYQLRHVCLSISMEQFAIPLHWFTSSSSSSYICHGVGPLVDPFRSHVLIYMKVYISVFFENLSAKFQFHYNLTRITATIHEDL